jgi:hypothetical protein
MPVADTQPEYRKQHIDDELLVIETLKQIDVMHVRVMKVLSQPSPFRQKASGGQDQVDPFDETFWPPRCIIEADPGLTDGLRVVLAALESLGIVERRALAFSALLLPTT